MPMSQMPGNLDISTRMNALCCISDVLEAHTLGQRGQDTWFRAALLFDRFTASSSFCLEQLPLTCACLTGLVLKTASTAAKPLAGENYCSMTLIKDFAAWLDSTQSLVTLPKFPSKHFRCMRRPSWRRCCCSCSCPSYSYAYYSYSYYTYYSYGSMKLLLIRPHKLCEAMVNGATPMRRAGAALRIWVAPGPAVRLPLRAGL